MAQQKDARRGPAYRLAVAGRIVLAVLGGYGVAALLTALLSLTLPLVRSEAVASATLVSFAVMVAVVVYVFAARALGRAALAVVGLAAVLGGGLWLASGFSAAGAA
ncbi:iron transporter [Methylobacterium sp. WL103]|uniref:iron transporter n=1 Tax=unclassified Methylobacterium TaxID=2615210 RepID=UPI0011CC22BD|nr:MULTISPECIES: iron transporter [unclassified Methylobacterium]TXM76680.1 iron transporter [Methylobacterium sp. WL12]TXN01666.1 iron transporter [Methylobacterium sp. WL103]